LSYQVVHVVVSIHMPAGSCEKFGWKIVVWKIWWGGIWWGGWMWLEDCCLRRRLLVRNPELVVFDGVGGCGWEIVGWGSVLNWRFFNGDRWWGLSGGEVEGGGFVGWVCVWWCSDLVVISVWLNFFFQKLNLPWKLLLHLQSLSGFFWSKLWRIQSDLLKRHLQEEFHTWKLKAHGPWSWLRVFVSKFTNIWFSCFDWIVSFVSFPTHMQMLVYLC